MPGTVRSPLRRKHLTAGYAHSKDRHDIYITLSVAHLNRGHGDDSRWLCCSRPDYNIRAYNLNTTLFSLLLMVENKVVENLFVESKISSDNSLRHKMCYSLQPRANNVKVVSPTHTSLASTMSAISLFVIALWALNSYVKCIERIEIEDDERCCFSHLHIIESQYAWCVSLFILPCFRKTHSVSTVARQESCTLAKDHIWKWMAIKIGFGSVVWPQK